MSPDDLLDKSLRALRETTRPHREGMERNLQRQSWAQRAVAERSATEIQRSSMDSQRSVNEVPRTRSEHERRGSLLGALAARFRARGRQPVARRLGIPLAVAAVTLGGAVAWASTSPQFAALITSLTQADAPAATPLPSASPPPAPAPKSVQPKRVQHERAQLELTHPPVEARDTDSNVAPSLEPKPNYAPRPTAKRVEPKASLAAPIAPPSAPAALPKPTPPDARALFRQAHDLHFKGGDVARALEAWNAYLASAPPGDRWLPEARFNRAIALSRLGRNDAARRALGPFARGVYGGYRRRQAQQLLEQLASSSPPATGESDSAP